MDVSTTFTILGVVLAAVGVLYAIKQYQQQAESGKHSPSTTTTTVVVKTGDTSVTLKPDLKVTEEPITTHKGERIEMNDEYYTRLGVDILRSKKMGDSFDLNDSNS